MTNRFTTARKVRTAATHRPGGHHWLMIACCIPMLAIAVGLVATGVVGAGVLIIAIVCIAMMAAMMRTMPRDDRTRR